MIKFKAGFTLIEILIALVIFAILSTMTMHAIHDILGRFRDIQGNFKDWHAVDDFVNRFQYQTRFYTKRSVKADQGHVFPEFIGQNNYIEWTFIAQPQNLRRIAYLCQNQQLIMRQWDTIDGLKRSNYRDRIILNHLTTCKFNYLDANLNHSSSWNTENGTTPAGLQVIINFSTHKDTQFWFTFPPETYASQTTTLTPTTAS